MGITATDLRPMPFSKFVQCAVQGHGQALLAAHLNTSALAARRVHIELTDTGYAEVDLRKAGPVGGVSREQRAMELGDRRRVREQVSRALEDGGIFKTQVGQFDIELVPQLAFNNRQDLLIKGFIDGTGAIDVVFAGQRTALAKPIRIKLEWLWARANILGRQTNHKPTTDEVRLGLRIEGAWRARFKRDDQGWETRDHQLYAARWTLVDEEGTAVTFGVPIERR